jgi:hypothetical protein
LSHNAFFHPIVYFTPSNAGTKQLLSVYLVGFQLPLSGAVLALPDAIGTMVRPFIAAYWSWSGYLQTLRETRFYDLVGHYQHTVQFRGPVLLGVVIPCVARISAGLCQMPEKQV